MRGILSGVETDFLHLHVQSERDEKITSLSH